MQPRTQEVPCGGLWARPELAATPGGKDILRSVEKPPPPSLPPASKEKGAGGGREVEACRVSSLLPETLGGQSRLWHWTHKPSTRASLPSDQSPFL